MKNIKWHVAFWGTYFIAVYIIDSLLDKDSTLLKEIIFFLSQNILLFYSLYYCLKKFSTKSKFDVLISVCRIVVILVIWICIRYAIRYYFLARFFQPEYGMLPFEQWFPTCFVWIINCFFYSFAYFLLRSILQKQRDLMTMQDEKYMEETSALRAQINPHFLYNTLDMLYAKARVKDRELSEAILLLADVMRYSIKPDGYSRMTNLTEEIEHLENVIKINQLRYNQTLHLDFNIKGETENVKIVPLVLITLLENVFKFGDLNDPEHPAKVQLEVKLNHTLVFVTTNKIRIGPKELTSGMGISNTIKRLKRVYGTGFTFLNEKDETMFKTQLSINLN
ncbi:sensor histidine kinase [Pedobacter sp. GR22-10]|uniref:sensor histidine kinase n=1 Tax=Pedobacter sp. GR22-10 TaxID=2994472 RepID=UPI002246B2CE|nr:sensor histidine kinase [Pedobacter sp. GR22-10]MCX2429857.1 histidine kinase [Pedobacter sp. GR22-10]